MLCCRLVSINILVARFVLLQGSSQVSQSLVWGVRQSASEILLLYVLYIPSMYMRDYGTARVGFEHT